jgi:hypothetical protein
LLSAHPEQGAGWHDQRAGPFGIEHALRSLTHPAASAPERSRQQRSARTTTMIMGSSCAGLPAGAEVVFDSTATGRHQLQHLSQGRSRQRRSRGLNNLDVRRRVRHSGLEDCMAGRPGSLQLYFVLYVTQPQQTGPPATAITIGLNFMFCSEGASYGIAASRRGLCSHIS